MLHTHIIVFAQIYAHILPQAINAILIYCSLLSANKNHNKKHWAIINRLPQAAPRQSKYQNQSRKNQ